MKHVACCAVVVGGSSTSNDFNSAPKCKCTINVKPCVDQMDILTFLIIVTLLHCVLFFLDLLAKNCWQKQHESFLQFTGLQVDALCLRWYTTAFNRPLQKWGIWRPRFLQAWFSIGTVITVLMLPLAVVLIVKTAIEAINRDASKIGEPSTSFSVEPLLPGLNLPISDLGYYWLTLLICSFFHEIGHAVAAVREGIHICGVGVVIVMVIPVMYVQLDTDQLVSVNPARRLHVFCAGVWHNTVLAAVALGLYWSLPWLLSPFYISGEGVYVQAVQPKSPLIGLYPGDTITAINNCSIRCKDDWYFCLLSTIKSPPPGVCTTAEFVRENDESVPEHVDYDGAVECCPKDSPDRLCYQLVEESGAPLEVPETSCLGVRALSEHSSGFCSDKCSGGLHCLRPVLGNATRLLQIEHRGKAVQVTDYKARAAFVCGSFPEVVARLCRYIVSISLGLAILNILPCFFFDGQHIISALCDALLIGGGFDSSLRRTLVTYVSTLGTVLLVATLGLQLVQLG